MFAGQQSVLSDLLYWAHRQPFSLNWPHYRGLGSSRVPSQNHRFSDVLPRQIEFTNLCLFNMIEASLTGPKFSQVNQTMSKRHISAKSAIYVMALEDVRCMCLVRTPLNPPAPRCEGPPASEAYICNHCSSTLLSAIVSLVFSNISVYDCQFTSLVSAFRCLQVSNLR